MRRAPVTAVVAALLLAGCGDPAPDAAAPAILTTDAGDEMVAIPAGTFRMGSKTGEPDERPVHDVELDAFLIDRHEVTQAMFARLQLPDPSRVQGKHHPVDNITWVLAAQFCNERSLAEGLEPCYDEDTARCDFDRNGYRLPTEAEWEYACRAGSAAAYGFGDQPGPLREHAWFAENSGGRTHAVGTRRASAWGLYDMHGNVAEWCQDAYAADYYAESPRANPRGPDPDLLGDGAQWVVRGGSWNHSAAACRAAARDRDRPGFGDACLAPDSLGLRCVRRMPPGDSAR